jgi:hypothetical protein
MTLNKTTLCHYAECHYAECHYAECNILFIIILNGIMLSVVMLNVVTLRVMVSMKDPPSFHTSLPSFKNKLKSALDIHFLE